MSYDRRNLFKISALAGIGTLLGACDKMSVTPSEIEGPFYPKRVQADKDFDLTQIEGHAESALGEKVFIRGTVNDQTGQPVSGATVDLWQANSHGRYRHSLDNNKAPLDPHFQGWAIVQTGQDGSFKFKTIIPGAYPVSPDWKRPPHIHMKVTKLGFKELITQMYFPDQELNKDDHLLQSKSSSEQKLMIAQSAGHDQNKIPILTYNIVIENMIQKES